MTAFVHVHAPEIKAKRIVLTTCLDCRKRTRLIGTFQEWYGWTDTCMKCGRTWADGEWTALDFVRGARAKSVDSAKRSWRSADCKVMRIDATG